MTTPLIYFYAVMHKHFYGVIKKIVAESFAVTDITAVTRAVLFRSGSIKGSGFHANVLKTKLFSHANFFHEVYTQTSFNPSFTKGGGGGARADPQRFFFDNF